MSLVFHLSLNSVGFGPASRFLGCLFVCMVCQNLTSSLRMTPTTNDRKNFASGASYFHDGTRRLVRINLWQMSPISHVGKSASHPLGELATIESACIQRVKTTSNE